MSALVMDANTSLNSFKIKEEMIEEEFEEEDDLEEEEEEVDEDEAGDDEEIIEVVEIDENEIDYSDCVLMPYKDRIKTKPQITISAKRDFFQEKIYVPPSNCKQTIHERFTEIQTKLLKYQINPVFGVGGWNSLTYSGQRGKPSVFSRVGYFKANKNKAQYMAAMKLKKKSIKQLAPVVGEDGKTYSKGSYWRNKFKWFGSAKTREELDEEIDDYMAKRGKVDASPDDEGNDADESITEPKKEFFSMVQKIKKWAKNSSLTHEDLNKDLDTYMCGSKSKLDEELDAYMAEAAKARAMNGHTESGNLLTNGNCENENSLDCGDAQKLVQNSDDINMEDMEVSFEM